MTLRARCLAAWALALVAGAAGAQATTPVQGDAVHGRALFETARLRDGSPVAAWRDGVPALPPRAAACAACHRPSGRGGTEGGVRVPAITGDLLFQPGVAPPQSGRLRRQWLRHQTRSAYDARSLARALAEGLDPDGQALAAAMPRYRLDEQALADLTAYLSVRGREPISGLDGPVMHLASVVTPQAGAQRRATVVQALQAWQAGMAWGRTRVQWTLWELQGEPAGWGEQLRRFWQRQPVYALLSGAGGDEWAPVQAWCEAQRVPCLFPSIDRVPADNGRHWSFYLSGGVQAEARMLAQRLAAGDAEQAVRRVWQLASGASGRAAASALAAALAAARPELPVRDLPESDPAASAIAAADGGPAWQAGDLLALWLPGAQAQAWLQRHAPPADGAGPRVVLSAQLAPPQSLQVPPRWRERLMWVSQRADPVRQAAGASLSLRPWAQRLGLAVPDDPSDLADVHAATFFFADAVAQALGQRDPQYLLERLEVAVDLRPAGAGYHRLSLGPGQRVAAQGGFLLAFKPPAREKLAPLPGYLRADD